MATLAQALPWVLSHEVIGWPVVAGQPEPDLAKAMARVKAVSRARRGNDSFWFTNDPDDPGGATAWGITLAKAQKHGIGTVEDLRQITAEKVAEVYRADYFCFYEGIDDQRVATKILDLAVNVQEFGNHGPAIRIVQDALNALGAGLEVDGVLGQKTEASVNACRPEQLLAAICTEAADYYRSRVEKRPRSVKFLDGWLKRASEVPA